LSVNGEFSTSIVVSRCWQTPAGSSRWLIRFDMSLAPDITVVVRMDMANQSALDYYLLPIVDVDFANLRLAEENGACIDTYRFDDLSFFFGMAEHVNMRLAA